MTESTSGFSLKGFIIEIPAGNSPEYSSSVQKVTTFSANKHIKQFLLLCKNKYFITAQVFKHSQKFLSLGALKRAYFI
jgi:hypothetical protein